MSVYKNQKTGKWYCVYRIRDIKGNLKQKRKDGFETRELAYQYECESVSDSINCIKEKIKFRQLYDLYIKSCKFIRATATIDGYNYCYNKYLKVFDDLYVDSITLNKLDQYRKSLLKDISIYRINYIFKLLSRILDYGVKCNYIVKNVANILIPLKDYSVKKSKVDFYTVDEFKSFISVVPGDSIFYVVFNILYYTGLRSGELLALDCEDVNLDKGIIKVNKSLCRDKKGKYIIKTTKTCSSTDNVYIPNSLKSILGKYLKDKDKGCLFSYNNKRLTKRTLENKKNRYCDQAGLRRIRIHDFRHSFASLIYELSNYNYSEVAKRLRHANVSTVMQTYIHVFPTRRNEVDNKLDNI